MDPSDEWTTAHDLALIYSGLACIDRELTDDEVEAIKERLLDWVPLSTEKTAQEVVQEAARALKSSQKAVRGAIHRVGRQFDPAERRDTLDGLLRIARADGVLLESEREMIHTLAEAWDLKQLSEQWGVDASSVVGRRGEDWELIHEIAFLFVQEGRGEVSPGQTDVCLKRLQEWQPELSETEGRDVLQRALRAYEDHSGAPLFPDSVKVLGRALPSIQQLLVLDDLHTLAQVDGPPTREERRLIRALAEEWGVNVRLDGGN